MNDPILDLVDAIKIEIRWLSVAYADEKIIVRGDGWIIVFIKIDYEWQEFIRDE